MPGGEGPLKPLKEEGLINPSVAPLKKDQLSGLQSADGPAESTPISEVLDSPHKAVRSPQEKESGDIPKRDEWLDSLTTRKINHPRVPRHLSKALDQLVPCPVRTRRDHLVTMFRHSSGAPEN